jgi:hypothetical protein
MEYAKRKSGLWVPDVKDFRDQKIAMGGRFFGQIIRKGELIDEFDIHNLVVNQGLNDNLNTYFNAGSQITAWYMGIFQGNYTPVASDTASSIAGNSTECSSYNASTRPSWTPAAPSSQSITNAANRATFTFNASVTVYGAFLISNNTIGGTSGILFAGAQFGAAKSVVNLDQLLLTYQFSASSV